VTFLFVLMLAQPEGKATSDRVSWEALVSAALGMVIVGVLTMNIGGAFSGAPDSATAPLAAPSPAQLGQGVLVAQHVAALGTELFGRHLIAIEVTGTLLLAAVVGAAVIVSQGKDDVKTISETKRSAFKVQETPADPESER
jgi:NADH:ubiquinone oxidoreductase subunit 6 (subunit J)